MAKSKTHEIDPVQLNVGTITITVLGRTPLLYHAMSQKAAEQLLFPENKTAAERRTTLKHNPMQEYRDSVYKWRDDDHPTRLNLKAVMFKMAMAEAALRVPGSTKTEVKQLTWVEDDYVDVYGIPQIYMAVTRSADIAKTPDIRTRAIVPQWCCQFRLQYTQPFITARVVGTLLSAAGLLMGVGDGRQQKGSLNFGQFELVDESDPRVQRLMASAGRKEQDAALAAPVAYDAETEALLAHFNRKVAEWDDNRKATLDQPATKAPRGHKEAGNGLRATP